MPSEPVRASAFSILYACLQRDVRIALSYRLAFLLRFLGTFFQVAVFFFISQLMVDASNPALAAYGDNYFSYVLVGLAFQRLFSLSLTGYATVISEAQQMGTLEVQALLPTSLPLLVAGSNLWPYLYASGETLLYLLLGVLLGASLAGANLVAALVVALFACIAISGLGFLGAAIILLYKRGNAVAWGVQAATSLLAGIYFPPELLPQPLQKLSVLLPQTFALEGLRGALLLGADLPDLLPELGALLIFTIILLPAGLFAMHISYRQAHIRGSLAQY